MFDRVEVVFSVIGAVLGAAAAWFGLRSDVRSLSERITTHEKSAKLRDADMTDVKNRLYAIELINERADEHRKDVLHRLDRMQQDAEKREDRVDAKLDTLMSGVTALTTTVEERTKQLHSP
jgi:chromosome segregation ATPase